MPTLILQEESTSLQKLGYQYVINENLMFYCSSNYIVQKAELHNLHNGNIIHTEPLTLFSSALVLAFIV